MKNLFILLVILGVLLFGFFVLPSGEKETSETSDEVANDMTNDTMTEDMSENETETMDETGDLADTDVTVVRYTNNGFTPSSVTISVGETVRFVNEMNNQMWVASALHPTHEVYDGTSLAEHCADGMLASFDQCEAGAEYSFTFDKAGTWKYHNHMNASDTGEIIVQ